MVRICMSCALLLSCLCSRADAVLVFTFSPVAGGTQTRLTLSTEPTVVAISSSTHISDNTLSFDFVDVPVDAVEFPNPGNFTLEGSLSGVHTVTRVLVDDDSPGTDDLQFEFSGNLTIGETLVGSGTDVVDVAFANFLSGGAASNPFGAEFRIVLSAVPEPSGVVLAVLGMLGLVVRWGRRA